MTKPCLGLIVTIPTVASGSKTVEEEVEQPEPSSVSSTIIRAVCSFDNVLGQSWPLQKDLFKSFLSVPTRGSCLQGMPFHLQFG